MTWADFRASCRRQLWGRKLIFWLVWYSVHLGTFAVGWYTQYTNSRLALLNSLRYSVWISRGAGLVLALDGFLILLPVLRNVLCYVRPKLRRLPLDENIFFHKQVAYSIAFWAMVHTTAHYVNFYNVEVKKARPVTAWQIHYTEVGGVTGHIMLLCLVLMYTTAQIKIRNQSFEAFWYTHHLGFIFMIALYSHASGCFVRDTALPFSPFAQGRQFWEHCIGYQSFRFDIFPGIAYVIERIWREIRARRQTKITKIIMHPRGVIEIQFVKPSLKYKAGQYLFLNIPDLSAWQYHPFTITSCPADPYVSVHIRQVGDWTMALGKRLGIEQDYNGSWHEGELVRQTQKALEHCHTLPQIRVDGPYGCPAEDIEKNQVAIICGAGIGITPWASVLKNIYHRRTQAASKAKLIRIELIWIARDNLEFEWFQELLAELERPADVKGRMALNCPARPDFLKLHIFLTKKLGLDDIKNYIINDDTKGTDTFTRLASKTKFGRPNFDALLGDVKDRLEAGTYVRDMQYQAKTTVGFYFCGPSGLGKSIAASCRTQSSSRTTFDFHKEHF